MSSILQCLPRYFSLVLYDIYTRPQNVLKEQMSRWKEWVFKKE